MAHPYDVADKSKFKAYQTERKGQNLQQHLKPIIGALTGQSTPSKPTLVSVGPVIFIVWERGSGGGRIFGAIIQFSGGTERASLVVNRLCKGL